MASAENELLDRAMESAEAQLADGETAETHSQLEESTPISDEQSEAPVEAKESGLAERREKKTRDSSGKFKKGGIPSAKPQAETQQVSSDQNAEEGVETDEVAEEAPSTPSIEAPPFWSAEEKAAFAKAPPDVQQVIARKEALRNEFANRLAREAEPAKAYIAKTRELWEPHRAKFATHGVRDEHDAMARLLGWNEVLENDPKFALADLMQKNGLTGYDFIHDETQSQIPYDPRLDEALQSAEEAKRVALELQASLDNQRRSQGVAQVEAFRNGQDSAGQQRTAFFDAYRPQIAQAFEEIRKQAPNMPEEEVLHHAYEFVVSDARKLFGINGAVQTQKPKLAVVPKNARAAASSVSGGPSGDVSASRSKLKGNNFNEKLDNSIDAVMDHMGF